MKFEKLFTPIKIRGMKMENRVVFPAMGTKMPTEDKFVTQKLINYHVARAEGGNGLNMVEVSSVHAPSAPKYFLSIAEDKYIPELKKLTEEIRNAGGKSAVQLWQGGTAVASDRDAMIIVPSEINIPGTDIKIPPAKTQTIWEIIKAYGTAAKRAVEAGFDAIELHAGHSYSLHTFLSAAFNKREDEFGGSVENRQRYLLEAVKAIRKNIPEDMPLFMRIDAHDDYLENGLTIEDIIDVCKKAGQAGVDVLDVSRGNMFSAAIKYEVPPVDVERGFNVENAAKIRKETGMLTVAVGRINSPDQAEKILEDDKADMVVMGRAQLADAEFCKKAKAGKEDSIVYCVGCNQGCFDGFTDPSMPHITCLRNPALGLEKEMELVETDNPKKVFIAGGGIAGMEAAITLKRRGHNPVLFEKGKSLGGQFALAGMAPRKGEMKDAMDKMADMTEKEGIEIRLETPLTKEIIEKENPDEVIIAIGAKTIELAIEGKDLDHVYNSHEVLAGEVKVEGEVVVIGGGLVGLEVAEYLSERGNKASVVEMMDEVGKDLGQLRKISVMESMYKNGIKAYTNAKCLAIKENTIIIKEEEKTEEIKADVVVIAIGSRSRDANEIKEYCDEKNIKYHTIGDAFKARRALNATAEAAKIAREI